MGGQGPGRNAAPFFHRAEAGSVAKMGNYNAAISPFANMIRQDARNIFIRQSMKSIADNAFVYERPRQGEKLGESGLRVMITCIEAGDLGESGMSIQKIFNWRQIVRLMKWREGDEILKFA